MLFHVVVWHDVPDLAQEPSATGCSFVIQNVPKPKWQYVAFSLKSIHAQEACAAALRKSHVVHRELLSKILAPGEYWAKIRTTDCGSGSTERFSGASPWWALLLPAMPPFY